MPHTPQPGIADRDGVRSNAVMLMITLHVTIAVFLCAKLNIWLDEAYTLDTTSRAPAAAAVQAMSFECQPPLFFAALSGWRLIDDSIFFARMFSVASTVVMLCAVSRMSRRLLPDVNPAWIVAVLGLSPISIWAATEVRVYAFAIMLSALLLMFFVDGYVLDSGSRRTKWLCCITAYAALLSQYYLGFLLTACAAGLLVLNRWRACLEFCCGMAAVGCCFSPMLLIIPEQLSPMSRDVTEFPTFIAGAKHILWRVQDYLLPVDGEFMALIGKWLWRVILVGVLFCGVAMRKRLLSREVLCSTAVTGVVGAFYFILTQTCGIGILQERHTVGIFVVALVTSFIAAHAVSGGRGVAVWSLVCLAFSTTALVNRYEDLAKSGDWSRVAEYLVENEADLEPIVVFAPTSALPLSQYYDGLNDVVPVPRAEECEVFDVRDYVLKSPEEVQWAVRRSRGGADRIWLVTSGAREAHGVDYGWDVLDQWIEDGYEIESSREFKGTTVRALRRG